MSVHNSSTSLNQGLQNPQTHFGNLIPSERASPNDSQLNISTNNNEKNYTRRSSVQTSPINLTQNLQDLSLSSSAIQAGDSQHLPLNSPNHDSQHIQQQQQQQHFTLKIKNLPNDITSREAHSIFTFAKDFAGLELIPDSNNVPTIYAKFKSLSAASTHSQILESTQIFGSSYPYYLKAEIVDTSFTPQLNLGSAPSSNKRPSIGTQRSRFLFSDPFSTEAIAESQELQNANGVGKSLIMMESQQDAREYDQLVRDPWQSTGSSAVPNGSLPPSSAHGVQAQNSQPTSANASFSNSTPQTPGVEWDRRRQGSVFFNNQSPLLSSQLSSSQISTSLSLNNQIPQQPNQQNLGQPNIGLPPLSATSNQQISSLLSSNQNPLPQSAVSTSSGQKIQVPPNSAQSGLSDSQPSSQVDLSLLARIPPPANPADQNLPCNTLYVGNLPPDATEAELRQLFAPQRGFRRLSFKTKTQTSNGGAPVQSGHIHGPMCFVEFEDVAYATRALAELYGRTLPRPGGLPGKGGIRLSFSKNPLGVRGPGQRRTSGFAFNQPVFKN